MPEFILVQKARLAQADWNWKFLNQPSQWQKLILQDFLQNTILEVLARRS